MGSGEGDEVFDPNEIMTILSPLSPEASLEINYKVSASPQTATGSHHFFRPSKDLVTNCVKSLVVTQPRAN